MKLKKHEALPLTGEEMVAKAKNRADAKKAGVNEVLGKFGSLPNEAYVRVPVVAELYACSESTLWRNVQKGVIPKPRKFGLRVAAWNVGELRAS